MIPSLRAYHSVRALIAEPGTAGLTTRAVEPTIPAENTILMEELMPKIRHLAIKTKDPARLAKFYEEVFGMMSRTKLKFSFS
jgi:catechol-2,3-dioxygenase